MKRKFNRIKISLKLVIFIFISLAIFGSIPFNNISADATTNNNSEKRYFKGTIDDNFCDDKVIVVLTREETNKFIEYSVEHFPEIDCASVSDLTECIVDKIKNKNTENTLINVDNFKRILCLELENKTKENVLESIRKLEKRNDILSAGPDIPISFNHTPNDPNYSDQWGLSKIKAFDLYDTFRNYGKVLVGVLDTGIDSTHEDLQNMIHRNVPHNLTTTLHRDFTDNTDAGLPILNPTDLNGHGTHVAGIIGAEIDNEKGIAGVSNNVSLVSIRVLNANGSGDLNWLIRAIQYCATVNIPIINCSLGSPDLDTQLDSAIDNYTGLLVCAAGNNDKNIDSKPSYPASCGQDNIITVGATDIMDKRSNWNGFYNLWGFFGLLSAKSNYGSSSVDLFAPGSNIKSTMPENKYEEKSGTSMATPFVTGAAALLLSINSNLTVEQIKTAIMDGTDYCESLKNICVSEGRLNIRNSIKYINEFYPENSRTLSNYSSTYNHNKTIVAGNSYFNEKNGFYKLNVTYAKNYEFIISSDKPLNVTLYDDDYNELTYTDINTNIDVIHFINYLNEGTYYMKTNYINSDSSGIINTKIVSRNTVYLGLGENDILINTYNNINVYNYINTSGSGFCKISIEALNNNNLPINYLSKSLKIYDHNNTNQEVKYDVLGYSENAENLTNTNYLYIYLERNGYYYIHINIPNILYNSVKIIIEKVNVEQIDVLNRYSEEFSEILIDNTMKEYATGFKINFTSSYYLSAYKNGQYFGDVTFILFKKEYDSSTGTYYKTELIGEYLSIFDRTITLDEGTYYLGYFGNRGNVPIVVEITRIISTTNIMNQVIVMDPGINLSYGTEVRHNNGLFGGTTITEGFTRHIHFNSIEGVPSISRYDYNFYSSNNNIATVSEFGTVFAKKVSYDRDVTIIAVYKANPTIIFDIELTILDSIPNNPIVIETYQTINLSDFQNGKYKLELNEINSAYPWIQYYNWSIYVPCQLYDIVVTMDDYGFITTTNVGYFTLTGLYSINPNITLIIHITIV